MKRTLKRTLAEVRRANRILAAINTRNLRTTVARQDACLNAIRAALRALEGKS